MPSELWKRLKQRLFVERKGLSEISENHPKYELTQCIRQLLRTYLPETKSRYQLQRSDYTNHLTMVVNRPSSTLEKGRLQALKKSKKSIDKQHDVIFTIYAPTVFATLRAALGISHEDFLMSAAPSEEISLPYLQYKTNSKGHDSFFFTYDRRFVFKMENCQSMETFMSLLEEYLGHFITSPHSLIAKILGAFSLKQQKLGRVNFIVIQSIFWPSTGIQQLYDIKGCLGGRYQDEDEAGDRELVLKDQNFIHRTNLRLGREGPWFLEQITRDVRFLQRIQRMDYSLLIGVQPLRNIEAEKGGVEEGSESEVKVQRPPTGISLQSLVSSVKRSSLSFGERPGFLTNLKADHYDKDISQWVDSLHVEPDGSLQVVDMLRPVSNLSVLKDLVREEMSPNIDESRKKSAMKNTDSARKSSKRVRFDESVEHNNKDSSQLHVVPAITGLVSPVPSIHFQVHEPPPATSTNSIHNAHCVKSRLCLNNKTYPLEENRDLNADDEVWYLDNDTTGKKQVKIKRSKGYGTDLDRIEVAASPTGVILTEDQRRHSIVIQHWLRSNGWQNENRRLLPDSPNGVHIIDGVDHRYYLGIIDIFTTYSFRQRFGRLLKSILYCSTDHSSAPPEEYANRFIDFLEDHLI